ncbi:MAG: transcription antitermination factor NusB [Deltaproteobacteria bacterium]|nr:transcription antitermination factor NusB [Deltaproteobacteria bacterium]
MGSRRQARELALQVLFHMGFCPGDPGECFDLICEHFGPSQEIRPFSRQLVLGVCERMGELDEQIRRASRHWRPERMSRVDLNVLRIALFEVLFLRDVPPKVSIDEAVELGKRYGSEESGAFINGILDHVYHDVTREEMTNEE